MHTNTWMLKIQNFGSRKYESLQKYDNTNFEFDEVARNIWGGGGGNKHLLIQKIKIF